METKQEREVNSILAKDATPERQAELEKLRKYSSRYSLSDERYKAFREDSAAISQEFQEQAEARLRGLWQQGTLTGRIPSRPPLQQFPYIRGNGLEESSVQHTGDRCCIARGNEIFFEGTEAECRTHAKKILDPQHLGYEQVSIYAPLAVVSRKSEIVVDFREISKVKK